MNRHSLKVLGLLAFSASLGAHGAEEDTWNRHQRHFKRSAKAPGLRLQSQSYLRSALNVAMGNDGTQNEILEAARGVARVGEGVDLQSISAESYSSQKFGLETYHDFAQFFRGYRIEGAGIQVLVQESGGARNIALVDSALLEDQDFQFRENLTRDQALALAGDRSKSNGYAPRYILKSEKLLRIVEGAWRPVYGIQFENDPYFYSVDMETGAIHEEAQVYSFGKKKKVIVPSPTPVPIPSPTPSPLPTGDGTSYQMRIKGRGIAYDPVLTKNNLSNLPLSSILISGTGVQNAWTDFLGNFSFARNSANTLVEIGLKGNWVDVQPAQGKFLIVRSELNSAQPSQELTFNPIDNDEFSTSQVNAYYHVNIVHDWLKERAVIHQNLDRPVRARVNVTGACNANYFSGGINFFQKGNSGNISCPNMAYDTVIYHEYGHLVDDVFGGMMDGGLSEGWGDVLAVLITGKPAMAEGFYGAGTVLRTGDNKYQFPANPASTEVHTLGQAWAGFVWHLRAALLENQGSEGAKICEDLVMPALVSNARDIPSAVRQVWIRGGNQYAPEILKAAKAHSLEGFLN